ncbi:EAL domain-containing protein [Pseudaeromonas sp. ZJS20]|uniref:putative bifunctional diguanylate cyclase/phosphodiesterase n=1 Tax=Pseudaeromonas aegiceratis TaxID=3153928 RepID=UPI00390CD961
MRGRRRFISLRNQLLLLLLIVLGLLWLALDALARYEVSQSNNRRMEQTAQGMVRQLEQALGQQAQHNRHSLLTWLAQQAQPPQPGWHLLRQTQTHLQLYPQQANRLPEAMPFPTDDRSRTFLTQPQADGNGWQLHCPRRCLLLQRVTTPPQAAKGDAWLLVQPVGPLLQQLSQQLGIRFSTLDEAGQPIPGWLTEPGARLPDAWLAELAHEPLPVPGHSRQQRLDGTPLYLSYQAETAQLPPLLLTLPMGSLLQEQAVRLRHFRIWLALGLLLGLGLIYLLADYPLRRLRQLANQLPELPETGYPGLKARLGQPAGTLEDEIDRLHQAALSLAGRLEALDSAVNAQHAELKAHQLYDPLTGLLNRGCFLFEFNRQLTALRRQPDRLALVLIDLDQFKDINDSLGHEAGDELLKTLARRLQQQVRETDLVARLTSDEFALLLCHLKQVDDIHPILEKLLAQLHEPMLIGQQALQIGASAGVAFAQDGEHTASELLRRADLAMHEAKRLGRQRYELFSAGLLEQSSRRFFIETQLDAALRDGQLYLNYQPWVQLPGGQVMGLEALVRWRHPLEGCIAPLEFIPVLEASSQIVRLGHWVMEQAFSQLQQLDRAGHSGLQMAINLSPHQLFDPQLLDVLTHLSQSYHIIPGRIVLELTEGVIIPDYHQACEQMLRLQQAGYQLAIDDFGTGYSSLAYLSKLPVNRIKLDRSFVLKMTESQLDRQLVQSVIDMLHAMGKQVIAEGVESSLQLELLRQLAADGVQGYFLAHPVSECNLPSQLQLLARRRDLSCMPPDDEANRHPQ